MRRKIEDGLLELGIKPNLNGFGYICDFIELIIDDEERKFKMMYLYSVVAKKNKTTSTSVERAIRHAISKINFECWNEHYVYSKRSNLTNAEFLYTFALRIKQED